MAIYRGPGGAGDANSDITINLVTELTQEAEDHKDAAASSASAAATSAANALTSENNASPVNAIVSEITTVAGISSDVTTVSGIASNVTTVATNNANVSTVAGISSDVTTVATNNANVTTVATDIANVNTVAGIDSDVSTVAGISTDVTAVVADATDIGTVATDLSGSDTIGTVATNIANVNTVAGISSDVTAVAGDATDIGTVATNLTTTDTIGTVSGNITNVNTVAGISADVTAVAADATDIGTVATNITNVNNVGTNIANVNTVATNIADVQAAATNIADIQAVADEVAKVITVANDLNEATSEIDTVANSIANVDTVGTNIASVNNVAANIASVNNFGDTYFVSSTAPSSPTIGDLWFDTTNNIMKVYTASGFANAGSSVNGTAERASYVVGTPSGTYTGSTTVFPATYDAGYVDFYLNGVKLIDGTDFTASNGTSITLTSAATSGDSVDIVAYGTFELANFSINDANDVNTAGVTDGQALLYNATSGDFEAGDVSVDLSPYAPLASPSLTGTPTAPTATTGTNTTQLATTAFVQTELGTVDLTSRVAKAGDTMTGDLNFGDNVKAQFGASNDLQISHNGSHSIIQDVGTGNLYVSGTELALVNGDFSQTYALFNSGGGSNLYHNNASKFSTTATGVSVTGDMTLASSGAVNSELRSDFAGLQLGTTSNHYLAFRTNNTERARIDTSGNFKFNSGYGSPATAYGCRAWVNFNGTTAPPSIRASGNVSSITDNGTGTYTVNFTTAMPDANYAVNATASTDTGGGSSFGTVVGHPNYGSVPSTTSVNVRGFADNGTAYDKVYMWVSVHR